MPSQDEPQCEPGDITPADSSQTIAVDGIPSSFKAGVAVRPDGPSQTVFAKGIPSSFKAGEPTLVKQYHFSGHSLPDAPDALKREVADLAHSAIAAVTRDSSVTQFRPEDWLERLRVHGYTVENMEQLLTASVGHLHSLALDHLAVGTLDRSKLFEELETRFSALHARLRLDTVTPPGAAEASGKQRRFRKAGDFWEVAFDGAVAIVKHTNGVEYIARLLMSPGRSFGCIELAQAASQVDRPVATLHAEDKARLSTGLAGQPLQDTKAQAAIKNDLNRIDSELADANAMHNEERAEQLRTEMEAILEYFRKSFGRGGRARVFPEEEERARKAVSLAIQRAITMIAKVQPQLAQHLTDRVDTGLECCYKSDGVVWDA